MIARPKCLQKSASCFALMISFGPTIASNDEELIVGVDVVYLDVGERSNDLLLRGEIGALLELEVTYRAGQGKVAVDATEVDKASCGLDTCLLGWE